MFTATQDNIPDLKNATPSFQANAGETKEKLINTANKAGHKVREFLSSAGDEISHVKETTAARIRAHPVRSSLIALGVGLALGALFRR